MPDLGHAAGVVVSEATRLERLIGDLLDLAKLEAHQFTLSPVETDLSQTVANAADALRYEFDATGVALLVNVPAQPIVALADADRIGQILANLVENALKFASTSVEVSLAEQPGGAVALAVADDGPGIDQDDLPHVFERLFTSGRHFAALGRHRPRPRHRRRAHRGDGRPGQGDVAGGRRPWDADHDHAPPPHARGRGRRVSRARRVSAGRRRPGRAR